MNVGIIEVVDRTQYVLVLKAQKSKQNLLYSGNAGTSKLLKILI